MVLSKSDYKLARTCPAKLFYRKAGFPTQLDDEFMQDLAEAGYFVEVLVRLHFPSGVMIDPALSQAEAVAATLAALAEPQATVFEGTVISNGRLIRADILHRDGDTLELIEIKSRSCAGAPQFRTRTGTIRAEWRSYIEDVTFQALVLADSFPELTIRPALALLDSSRPMPVDRLTRWISIETIPMGERGFSRQEIVVDGAIEAWRDQLPVLIADVSAEVALLSASVRAQAAVYVASLEPLERLPAPLTPACQQCEFRHSDPAQSGFDQCWGPMARVAPHILDLYRATDQHIRPLLERMIAAGAASMLDIPIEQLERRGNRYTQRQRQQIEATRTQQPWRSPQLERILDRLNFPLHFIDFETARFGLPSHAGLPPYATEAFQWSCHTLPVTGAQPEHSEWLCSTQDYPNETFARTLLTQLGSTGTILTWTGHEMTTLRDIAAQLRRLREATELADAIDALLASGRLVDLHAIAVDHYVHPAAGSSTGLKRIVEAIWRHDLQLRDTFGARYDLSGDSFYASVPAALIGGRATTIRNGAAAQKAYRQLQQEQISAEEREAWLALLRRYCSLDTLAMVLVWEHWRRWPAE